MSWGQRITLTLAIALNIAVCLSKGTDNFGDPFDPAGLLVVQNIFVLPLTVLGWVLFDERTWNHFKASLSPMACLTKHDVKDTGRLIEGLRYGNRHTRAMTMEALTLLLPSLSASDASRFEAHHLEILHRTIKQAHLQRECDFLMDTLAALEKIGDETTIAFLHGYLHTLRPPYKGRGSSERAVIQGAARNCLEVLESRQQAEAHRLLRASDAPGQTDTLLRPASYVQEDRCLLVRPTQSDGEAEDEGALSSQRQL